MLFSKPLMQKCITVYDSGMHPTIKPGQSVNYFPQLIANNNDIAVAIVDHVFYTRRLQVNEGCLFLVPDNPEFDCIPVNPDQIIGTVPFILRRN